MSTGLAASNKVPGAPDRGFPSPGEAVVAGGSAAAEFDRLLFRVVRAMFAANNTQPELDALPAGQWRLIWTIYRSPNATMKDYSERLRVSQSTVTQLADRLVRRGMAERHTDANDRRVVRLRPTESASSLLQSVDAVRRDMVADVWRALEGPARALVLDGLQVLAREAEAFHAARGTPLPPMEDSVQEPEGAPGPGSPQT
jgi:DNA-binding MarR family transcriptional regulator